MSCKSHVWIYMIKILVVDDALIIRMKLKKLLIQAGFDVVGEAENGKDAINRYLELRPDIVTMDIVMPEMDGIMATREIIQKDPSAKIIIMSSIHQKETLLKAIAAGASSYIVKPFEKDRITTAIEKLVPNKIGDESSKY